MSAGGSQKRGRKGKPPRPSSRPEKPVLRQKSTKTAWVIGAFLVLTGLAVVLVFWKTRFNLMSKPGSARATYIAQPAGTLTFNKDIAPIVFNRCAICHRPDQAAPFSLLSYREVKKHARQIADVVARRYMPPWPPERGYGEFADDRSLSADEIGKIEQWLAEGAKEGKASDLPSKPQWTEGWQLGWPDLVVEVPPGYVLPADGKDVYRNFVVPIPVSGKRYVAGVEFRPDNAKIVHHAFISVDETSQSRRLAGKENPPGFDGMELPDSAIMPGGQLLGWQPGKRPSKIQEGLSWALKPNTDLVLQMHMHPSGRPEAVRAAVGFFFTDQPPAKVPFRIKLTRFDFEIPAGETNFVVEQSYVLPVDVKLCRVLPHAHYLAKEMQGYAVLPNGEKKWLIWIKDWDFNWQGDYQYAQPVALPKGAKLVMHYTYDNSTNNVRNPNTPPKRVRQGLQTTDEMAGLVLQALADSPEDRSILAKDYYDYFVRVSIEYYSYLTGRDPSDGRAQMKLGRALFSQGKRGEGLEHLIVAARLSPNDDKAHYELGYAYLVSDRRAEAYQEFQAVLRLNPGDYQALGNLGWICMAERRFPEAEGYLEEALRLNPEDPVARQNLTRLRSMK